MLIHRGQHNLLWIILEVLQRPLLHQQLMMRGIREAHLWILSLLLEEEKDIEIYHLGSSNTDRSENTMVQISVIRIWMITGYSSEKYKADLGS